MQTSAANRAYIQSQESLHLTAYPDPPGSSNYSIGYGHSGVAAGTVWTIAQADAAFDADIAAAETTVSDNVKVPLSQGQFDALVDFVFSEGAGHFEGSTLLADLNAGDYASAAAQFPRWDYAGGQQSADLEARRQYEQQEFNT
jgi:lysozyme